MKLSLSLVVASVLVAGGASQAGAGVLFGSQSTFSPPPDLVTINTSTGVGTAVGSMGIAGIMGLAFDRNTNTLYGSNSIFGQLHTINTSTGVATPVGPLGFDVVRGLAFDPNTNTLYGSDVVAAQLLTINTSTGAASPVGPLGFSNVTGLAFDPNTNTLYGSDSIADRLLTINTSPGAGTAVGLLGGDVQGLAFNPNSNILYGTETASDQLLTINTFTGAGTAVGPLGFPNLRGLALEPSAAVIPEPSTFVLFVVAAGMMLAVYGRQRKLPPAPRAPAACPRGIRCPISQ